MLSGPPKFRDLASALESVSAEFSDNYARVRARHGVLLRARMRKSVTVKSKPTTVAPGRVTIAESGDHLAVVGPGGPPRPDSPEAAAAFAGSSAGPPSGRGRNRPQRVAKCPGERATER
jgi:hypothetical protein